MPHIEAKDASARHRKVRYMDAVAVRCEYHEEAGDRNKCGKDRQAALTVGGKPDMRWGELQAARCIRGPREPAAESARPGSHLPNLVALSGVVQDALRGGGLAGVNVGHDADVSVHCQLHLPAGAVECQRLQALRAVRINLQQVARTACRRRQRQQRREREQREPRRSGAQRSGWQRPVRRDMPAAG